MRNLFIILVIVLTACAKKNDTYNVLNFGAKGDSLTLSTQAIQSAIDEAYSAGGGTVIVPVGIYISGTIKLKSNVVFEVQAGAKIFGSADTNDYIKMKWGHNGDRQPYHLIIADSATNITICGAGTIDGNGPAFWESFNADSIPLWIKAKATKISPMMEIKECTDVRIKDITLRTGGGWTLHLYNSERVQVSALKILNNVYAPNGDGIDISGCSDVTISDCIIKTCDDAICLKTMVDTKECKRIVVNNCVIECLCAALKIGNESFRDIKQVSFTNCIIYGSSRAIGIYAESAGTVEDINISNIVCDTKVPLIYNRPIHISLYLPEPGAGSRNGDWMFKDGNQWDYKGRVPILRNINISNFICKTEGRILIAAENGRQIENLTMRDIRITYPFIENPIPNIDKAKSSQFSPKNPDAKKACAALVIQNVKNLVVDGLTIDWPTDSTIPSDWCFPKRIANGTLAAFYPNYSNSKPIAFNAIWARGVSGYIRVPLVTSSDKKAAAFDIFESVVKIVE